MVGDSVTGELETDASALELFGFIEFVEGDAKSPVVISGTAVSFDVEEAVISMADCVETSSAGVVGNLESDDVFLDTGLDFIPLMGCEADVVNTIAAGAGTENLK